MTRGISHSSYDDFFWMGLKLYLTKNWQTDHRTKDVWEETGILIFHHLFTMLNSNLFMENCHPTSHVRRLTKYKSGTSIFLINEQKSIQNLWDFRSSFYSVSMLQERGLTIHEKTSGLITHIHIDLKLANKNISKTDFCITVHINYIAQYILFRSRVWISCRLVRA